MNPTLDELGLKHGTDKASSGHDYLRRYTPYFELLREKTGRLLEIGVAGGNSIRLWQEYFPYFQIYGVDHNEEFIKAFKSIPEGSQCGACADMLTQMIHGDASFPEFWEKFGRNWCQHGLMDIVIDDASHAVWATYQALKYGWGCLAPGGLWIIEDCHASYESAFRRDNGRGGFPAHWTVVDLINDWSNSRLHEFGANQCGRPTDTDWEFVHQYKSLIILKKGI